MQSAMSRKCWSRGLGIVLTAGAGVLSAMFRLPIRNSTVFAARDPKPRVTGSFRISSSNFSGTLWRS